MRLFKHITILSVLLAFTVTSCRTIDKGLVQPEVTIRSEATLFNKILEQQPEFSTVTTKCSVSVGSLSSKAQVKMINGEYIQISLQPLLGIEVARIMITKDSLFVVDKIGAMVAKEPLSSIEKYIPSTIGIKELQKVLLGTPFVAGDTLTQKSYDRFNWVRENETDVVMQTDIDSKIAVSFRHNNDGLLQQITIERNAIPMVECLYSQYKTDVKGDLRPSAIYMQLNSDIIGGIQSLSISNINPEWNKKVVIDTKVSSKYKVVSLRQLIEKYIG